MSQELRSLQSWVNCLACLICCSSSHVWCLLKSILTSLCLCSCGFFCLYCAFLPCWSLASPLRPRWPPPWWGTLMVLLILICNFSPQPPIVSDLPLWGEGFQAHIWQGMSLLFVSQPPASCLRLESTQNTFAELLYQHCWFISLAATFFLSPQLILRLFSFIPLTFCK